MTGRSKPRSKQENGPEQRGKTVARSTKGKFQRGNPGGPGRGRALATQPGTARRDPSGEAIAYVELLDQLALAKAQLAGALSDLAEANGRLARAGREWSLALRALGSFPAARSAVLDAVLWPIEEAERAPAAGQASAGADIARPGGVAAGPADPGVPLPAEKREEPTVYNGSRRRPVPPGWGGRIETGRPRQRGVDGIGDRYGDSGPLTSQD